MTRFSATVAAALTVSAMPALAKTPLWDIPKVSQGLFDMAVANEVGKQCPRLKANKIKGFFIAQELFAEAKRHGYSFSEASEFVEKDSEKARLKARVIPYLEKEGVDINQPQSFCPLGDREIAKQSQIGALLRSN